ncbi:hypothetical protein RHMOL_Rhmol08G0224200 [Rhododendron molle]|uniref:Uncharacterized protein n=1 Tax=Rhododendron molle TaxID=49168 RepID=A0ACC0MSN0_RHOML|nr:hypothetical protein RHMOL_Rhmol08G0224200 [Rhododendron molle]
MEDVYERDDVAREARTEARIQQVAALADQISAFVVANQPRRHSANRNPLNNEEEAASDEETENPFVVGAPGGDSFYQRRENGRGLLANCDSRQWESGLKVDLPEFQGGLAPKEFLDWVATIEEILDFKRVPEDKWVALVATRFQGRVAAWWQQLKLSRSKQGKEKISSWENLKKIGSRSVDDYTTEFHQLVVQNDIAETEEQLVSRYIRGFREQLQYMLNMFDTYSVLKAHHRALQLERQANRKSAAPAWGVVAQTTPSPVSIRPTGNSIPVVPQAIRAGVSWSKCFKCGEPDHRDIECRKGDGLGKALFVDADKIVSEHYEEYDQEATYDESQPSADSLDGDVEEVVGDVRPLLVVRRSCYARREVEGNSWLRGNVFQSTCTIGGKVCRFVID